MDQKHRLTTEAALKRLGSGDVALAGKAGNQPVIVFRCGRWHMVTLGWLCDAKFRARQGIVNVNFMSTRRARSTVAEWLPYSELRPLEEVCPSFSEELAAKVLPAAADYRPLLENGGVVLAGGHTSDTLHSVGADAANCDLLIAVIADWMKMGQAGPFLHFERTYDALQDVATPP